MLRAGKVGLRARDEADVAVLHAELYEDIATRVRADSRPWRPIPAGSAASPYAVSEPRDEVAVFSVVELASGELAGEALLWAIDLHNRTAHLGLSLRPAFRGRGLGADVVAALCEYGFAVRVPAPIAGRHPGQQYRDDTGRLAGRVRDRGQAPPGRVGQRGLRRRGDPGPAGRRVGQRRGQAGRPGRDPGPVALTGLRSRQAGLPSARRPLVTDLIR
jgi:GNAT superfamily N-acetyltransferase